MGTTAQRITTNGTAPHTCRFGPNPYGTPYTLPKPPTHEAQRRQSRLLRYRYDMRNARYFVHRFRVLRALF